MELLTIRLPSRLARSGVVAALALQLSLAAHVAGGGCLEVVPVLLAGMLCAAGAWLVTQHATTLTSVLALVVAAQVAVHGLLACAGSDARPSSAMLAAHLAAAGGVALLLVRTDGALRAVVRLRARWLAFRLVLRVPVTVAAPPAPTPVAATPRTRLHDAGVRSVPVRRGPPAAGLRTA